ncbi:MAG: hypothetical protein U5L45_18110 [Saprospiraceae bacterium]|nr:hypothetical protein [Saprospiraceae bacterium]
MNHIHPFLRERSEREKGRLGFIYGFKWGCMCHKNHENQINHSSFRLSFYAPFI